jgi:hypothetical protein
MAQKHVVAIGEGGRHRGHPFEVTALELAEIAAGRMAGLPELNENAVLVAANGGELPRDQQIGGAGRLQRSADVIAEVRDLGDPEVGDVSEHGLECRAVAVNIGDRSELHWDPIGVMDDIMHAEHEA